MSIRLILFFISFFALGGCSGILDTPKTLWGSSTRALEHARAEAISQTFNCSFRECYEAASDALNKLGYKIFIDDYVHQHLVVMGIPGSVDTTEVGIFFSDIDDKKIRIDISSLSSHAKHTVAEHTFRLLEQFFALKSLEPA